MLPQASRASTPSAYGLLFSFVVLGVLNLVAWWSTRTISAFRNTWAIIASVLTLARVGIVIYLSHEPPSLASPGLWSGALAIAGLVIFSQGGSPADAKSGIKSSDAKSPLAKAASSPKLARPKPVSGDRTHPWARHGFAALSLVLEVVTIFLWTLWAHKHGIVRSRQPWYFTFTLAVLITTVLHECGHALVAAHFKMKLMSFAAGPLRWLKVDHKWKFKFNWEGLFSLGGAVRVVPTNPKQPRNDELFMIAAGPIANVVTGSLLLMIVLTNRWAADSQAWRILAYAASFSFIAAITNMLPFRTDCGGYSDGARILQLLTNSPMLDYFRSINAVAATGVTPQRYKDMDVARIERAAALFPSDMKGVHMKLCAYECHVDAGRIPEARAALAAAERIHDQNGIDLSAPLHTVFVTGHAVLNRNRNAARVWWDRMEAKGVECKGFDYWAAKSALLRLEGKQADANDAWQKASVEAEKRPQCGSSELDRDRLEMLRLELDGTSSVAMPVAPPPMPSVTAAPVLAPATVPSTASARPVPERLAPQHPLHSDWDPVRVLREAMFAQPSN